MKIKAHTLLLIAMFYIGFMFFLSKVMSDEFVLEVIACLTITN